MCLTKRLCGNAVMADIGFHENFVIQQIKDGRDDADHEHDGHGGPPSHAPVCAVIRVLSLHRFIADFSLRGLLLERQGGYDLIQAVSRRTRGLHQLFNVLVLFQQESFRAISGRRGVCGGLCREGCDGGDGGQASSAWWGRRFVKSSDVSLSQDAEASNRNLDWPQGKEVLFCQQVVGTLYIGHLRKTKKQKQTSGKRQDHLQTKWKKTWKRSLISLNVN